MLATLSHDCVIKHTCFSLQILMNVLKGLTDVKIIVTTLMEAIPVSVLDLATGFSSMELLVKVCDKKVLMVSSLGLINTIILRLSHCHNWLATFFLFIIDIDECAESRDNCAQICTDTDGSYTCSCEAGYDLASDGRGCNGENNNVANFVTPCHNELSSCFLDIDECSDGTHGCALNCTNTIGSYVCSCDVGYHLNEDGLQCDGNNTQIIILKMNLFLSWH